MLVFLGVGRAGNSAGSVKSLVVVKLYIPGTLKWGFRKKTGGRSLVTGRSVRNYSWVENQEPVAGEDAMGGM